MTGRTASGTAEHGRERLRNSKMISNEDGEHHAGVAAGRPPLSTADMSWLVEFVST